MPDKVYLRQFQALPLRSKVLMTELRIREWYNHFHGEVYVSFSGGKDSTVLADLVHQNYPDVPLVFANTGLEYPEVQAFARKMGAEFVRPKMNFSEVISKYGYPIISKENAEAIYYARRIRNSMGVVSDLTARRDLFQGGTGNLCKKIVGGGYNPRRNYRIRNGQNSTVSPDRLQAAAIYAGGVRINESKTQGTDLKRTADEQMYPGKGKSLTQNGSAKETAPG